MTGGDPVCWLSEVCADCGRIREEFGLEFCANCGHRWGEDPPPPRDRDEAGRARNARPRDGLGRPLPYGAAGVDRTTEGVRRTPEETLTEAQRLLDVGMPFHAHEVLEDAWKLAQDPERALWRGLAQLAVGLTHVLRGNAAGATALLRRGASTLEPFRLSAPHRVDAERLVQWAHHLAADVETAGGKSAAVMAPRLRTRQ